jgi:hypothetical protein
MVLMPWMLVLTASILLQILLVDNTRKEAQGSLTCTAQGSKQLSLHFIWKSLILIRSKFLILYFITDFVIPDLLTSSQIGYNLIVVLLTNSRKKS